MENTAIATPAARRAATAKLPMGYSYCHATGTMRLHLAGRVLHSRRVTQAQFAMVLFRRIGNGCAAYTVVGAPVARTQAEVAEIARMVGAL